MERRKRGFTLIELMVVIAIIALLVGLLLPALAKAQQNARSMKDRAQIREIHQAFLSWANSHKGKLPIPGLIKRKLDDDVSSNPAYAGLVGTYPGIGLEDCQQNNTARLYSSQIAQNYFDTAILIGPTEINPIVKEDTDYDFAEYRPADNVYWDPDFDAQIWAQPGQGFECNTSYAHEAICGDRKNLKWRDSGDSSYPILGTRGVRDGVPPDDPQHDKSPTLLLHGPKRQWIGQVVFADNHAEQIENFFPAQTVYDALDFDSGQVKDNIFAAEFTDYPQGGEKAAPDSWMVISLLAFSGCDEVVAEYDALLD